MSHCYAPDKRIKELLETVLSEEPDPNLYNNLQSEVMSLFLAVETLLTVNNRADLSPERVSHINESTTVQT
jgi:hypothetical protein